MSVVWDRLRLGEMISRMEKETSVIFQSCGSSAPHGPHMWSEQVPDGKGNLETVDYQCPGKFGPEPWPRKRR